MEIFEVHDKHAFMPLLLLADEQESMVEKYIGKGTMYVLCDNGVKGEILVADDGNGVLEIKNLAVDPKFKRQGYGRMLIGYICERYKGQYHTLKVGTGDSPLTVPFYEKCGFKRSYAVKNFFTDNYDHPVYECGTLLTDMIYFTKELR